MSNLESMVLVVSVSGDEKYCPLSPVDGLCGGLIALGMDVRERRFLQKLSKNSQWP